MSLKNCNAICEKKKEIKITKKKKEKKEWYFHGDKYSGKLWDFSADICGSIKTTL